MNNIIRLREVMRKYYGFAPDGIYCQATGKRIGTIDLMELRQLADMLVPRFTEDQDEELADDYAMRVFASMRPSMFWNKMALDSMTKMAEMNPRDTLAYLLNRLLAYRNDEKIGIEERLGSMYDRIKVYHYLSLVDWSPELDAILYDLVRIDAQLGLHAFKGTFTANDLFWIDGSFKNRLAALHPYIVLANAEITRLAKRRELETRFYRDGNTNAKHAHFSLFMNRKPPSQATVKLQQKAALHSELDALFNDIMGIQSAKAASGIRTIHKAPSPEKQAVSPHTRKGLPPANAKVPTQAVPRMPSFAKFAKV